VKKRRTLRARCFGLHIAASDQALSRLATGGTLAGGCMGSRKKKARLKFDPAYKGIDAGRKGRGENQDAE
jgi:hypothetical protein